MKADAIARMQALPVDDFYRTNIRVTAHGYLSHTMYRWRVQQHASVQEWGVLDKQTETPPPEALPPAAMFNCPQAWAR